MKAINVSIRTHSAELYTVLNVLHFLQSLLNHLLKICLSLLHLDLNRQNRNQLADCKFLTNNTGESNEIWVITFPLKLSTISFYICSYYVLYHISPCISITEVPD